MKKKIIYKEKRKKKWCRNLEISYCIICIVILYCDEEIILQDLEVYCNRLGSAIVLQYNCD